MNSPSLPDCPVENKQKTPDNSAIPSFPSATSLKKPCPKDFWARILKSPTLEDCGINRFSLRPLGKEALIRSIYLKENMLSQQYNIVT